MRLPYPVYRIRRTDDDLNHSVNAFAGKAEFLIRQSAISFPEADPYISWATLKSIVQEAMQNNDPFIIIAEDNTRFTEDYSPGLLQNLLTRCEQLNADILLGGVNWFDSVFPVAEKLYWINNFTGMQCTILFSRFYDSILNAEFENAWSIEHRISQLSSKMFVAYPFLNDSFQEISTGIKTVREIFDFYKNSRDDISAHDFENVVIPTYVINLPERTERRDHALAQFAGRDEFDVTVVEAVRHSVGAMGLWMSIRKIVQMAVDNEDDVIIICEDDHEFTPHYSREYLLTNIFEAYYQGIDYMSGGSGGVEHALPVSKNRYWGSLCLSTQFIVIYSKFFSRILEKEFDETVVADRWLSAMTPNKMVLYPFVSAQHDFGYSDVTAVHNDVSGFLDGLFADTIRKLDTLQKRYLEYYSE